MTSQRNMAAFAAALGSVPYDSEPTYGYLWTSYTQAAGAVADKTLTASGQAWVGGSTEVDIADTNICMLVDRASYVCFSKGEDGTDAAQFAYEGAALKIDAGQLYKYALGIPQGGAPNLGVATTASTTTLYSSGDVAEIDSVEGGMQPICFGQDAITFAPKTSRTIAATNGLVVVVRLRGIIWNQGADSRPDWFRRYAGTCSPEQGLQAIPVELRSALAHAYAIRQR